MVKRYQGPINDKEKSKQKLINAVGKVLESKGYVGLTVTNIAKEAGLDRRLITLYFDSVNNLVEIYFRKKDYWLDTLGDVKQMILENNSLEIKDIADVLLLNQLDYFNNNSELQKLVLWEISQKTYFVDSVSVEREQLASELFELIDTELEGKDIDLRAISALLVAGSYFMVLHSKSTKTPFCGIDINTSDGLKRIRSAISLVLDKTLSC
ncbi:TetR/AcrR family transcriptional regulator [Formosa sediminum]|uniref:TetR/AcrR family transcriptional regulator n=1 Tax=Formosa sediminum TaxID=2594004 RepID=A0A516GUS6_9FLAO|nr:TetR/AcrR family transcriptional regulator [Formosa sediminum]QDO95256.1 TetR/AcrR family transcriptional regulator [Formosa sediminum]